MTGFYCIHRDQAVIIMDTKSNESLHSGISKSNSTSTSRSMKLETAARMAELTYLAEVLRKRQALEREEKLVIERRNRELEEIKWKQQIMDVETELGVTKARMEVMHEFEEESDGNASFDGRSASDIEKWVMSNPSIPTLIKTNIHDDGDASMSGHDEDGLFHTKRAL